MKLKDFVNEFTNDAGSFNKRLVCRDGLDFVQDRLAEGKSPRWFCTDHAEREWQNYASAGYPLPLIFNLVWAIKEYHVRCFQDRLDAFNGLLTLASTKNKHNHCRDFRWTLLKQAFKRVGVTHYSED